MQLHEYDTLRAVEDVHWWYGLLHEMVERALEGGLPECPRILDAGCGTGGMLNYLCDKHPEWKPGAIGMDTMEKALQYCQRRGLIQIMQGNVTKLPFESNRFDVVLSLDVLYHEAVDEEKALAEMVRVLRPGGRLLLNLPAFNSLRGEHDLAVCGARRYKSCHVRKMLENRSLNIEMIHYWNAWLFLPLLMWRNWWRPIRTRRYRTESVKSDLSLPPRWLNSLMKTLGRMDVAACRSLRIPWGTSVFAVGIKLTDGRGNER